MNSVKRVLICQNSACAKAGAKDILAIFQDSLVPNVEIIPSSCLGQCGNGPMILVEPDGIWYYQVSTYEVPAVVERHLRRNMPLKSMLYPKFHS